VLSWGIDLDVWLQGLGSPALDAIFTALTFVGNIEFYLLLLPLVYWCFDKRTGVRLTLLFLASAYLCYVLKLALDTPRPFEVDPERVRAIVDTASPGFPSAHAMVTTVVWGYLATRFGGRFWIAGVCVPLVAGVSRLYLGVHFPSDVLGGWLLGAIVVAAAAYLQDRSARALASLPGSWLAAMAILAPALLTLCCFSTQTLKIASALAAAGLGLVFERRWVRFSEGGSRGARAARFALGVAVVLGAHLGLKLLMAPPDAASAVARALLAVPRYLFTGFWVAWGAPALFVKTGLATRSPAETA